MDAFREGEQMLFIDPRVCDDCQACVDACERGAVFVEEDLPEQWRGMAEVNGQRARLLPAITESRPPLGFPLWAASGASL
jgi:Fe-S-cluster-containing hydrogenase component 2